MANRWINSENIGWLYFSGLQISADGDCSHEIKRRLLLGRKVMTNLDSIFKSSWHYFANKGPSSQGYGFSCGHVWMWELDHKESWTLKNWCFWTVVWEKILESPLDCKEIQPVYSKGDQSWVFTGRTDVEAETPILRPPDVKSWLIWKDPDAGRDWRWEKGTREDEMVWWHHWLDGHEFGWTLGVGDGQGGLACCDSWGCKELGMTEQLNWTELKNEKINETEQKPETDLLETENLVEFNKSINVNKWRKVRISELLLVIFWGKAWRKVF